jgi:hypothetical protein
MSFHVFIKKMIIIQFFLLFLAANAPALSIYVHYMPWFQTQGRSGSWTHWGDTIPRHLSHFTPLIGLYDSRDPDVLEYQVLEMKYAGLDGLVMDWYGINNSLPEYGTQPIFQLLTKAGMKYAIVWEDRYAGQQGGAAPVLQFMENNFFKTGSYLKVGTRPVLLVWQITYLTGAAWQTNMNSVTFQNKPILLTRDNALTPAAEGAYSWINAAGGTTMALPSLEGFLGNSWPYMMPTALPRFVDDYPGFSYGTIDDQAGQMFVKTLTTCLESGADLVQIATWNDWQEGTIIEPSTLYQYRDLEVIQTMRKKYIDAGFSYTADNLRLPDRLFRERRQFRGNAKEIARLDSASTALFQGNPVLALNILDKKNTGINRPAVRATMPGAHSAPVVYDVRGRRVPSFDFPGSNANGCRGALITGVYIIKKGDGSSAARLLMPVH